MDQLSKQTGDVVESLNTAHSAEKARNMKMLLLILQNLRFLAHQGLALHGSGGDGEDSNFRQLFNAWFMICAL